MHGASFSQNQSYLISDFEICDRAYENRPPEHKKCRFLTCLLYHNLITIYTTATKSSLLLQNVKGFLLHLMEMGYCIRNGRYYQKYNSV